MCSGALRSRNKWRRKAETFSARSINLNPHCDVPEDPHHSVLWLRWVAGPDFQPHPSLITKPLFSFSMNLRLVSLSLSQFGPLWVLSEAQADKGGRGYQN